MTLLSLFCIEIFTYGDSLRHITKKRPSEVGGSLFDYWTALSAGRSDLHWTAVPAGLANLDLTGCWSLDGLFLLRKRDLQDSVDHRGADTFDGYLVRKDVALTE